jgi:hypothetical protein
MVWTINIFSTILANINNFFGYTPFCKLFCAKHQLVVGTVLQESLLLILVQNWDLP